MPEMFVQGPLNLFRREFVRPGHGLVSPKVLIAALQWCGEMFVQSLLKFFGRGRGSAAFHVRYHKTSKDPRQTPNRFSHFLPFRYGADFHSMINADAFIAESSLLVGYPFASRNVVTIFIFQWVARASRS
jgi:hypothetical protein